MRVRLERRHRLAALCAFVAALLLLPLSAALESRAFGQSTSLVSVELPGVTGRGYAPKISADGGFAAFWDGSDVLVRDLRARTTVPAAQAWPEGRKPFYPYTTGKSISADGRFVAFDSKSPLLAPDAPGGEWVSDVVISDLLNGTVTLVSRASGVSGAKGNRDSFDPSVSDDGRFVAFTSVASNLDPADTERTQSFDAFDIFVRDIQTGTTELASRASGPAGADSNGASQLAAISPDGRFVAFESHATNLDPHDREWSGDVYVRDLHTETTIRVTTGRGRGHEAGSGSFSSDGQFLSFSDFGQSFIWNVRRRTTKRVSVAATGGKANGASGPGGISDNGRYVAFTSDATNLQPYHTAPYPDVFVRDMRRRRTILASRAANRFGTPGNGGSFGDSVSADGRFVVFESRASNLHPQDRDRSGDVFLRDLGPAPFEAQPSASCAGRRATTILLPRSLLFRGTDAPDVVAGSQARDRIEGGSGRDQICGRGGPDRLDGGPGGDRISGGAGRDLIRSADKTPDKVDCGPGRDTLIADRLDGVRRCERIRVRGPSGS